MPTIEDRLRDSGRTWREHVDAAAPQLIATQQNPRQSGHKRRIVLAAATVVAVAGVGIPVAVFVAHRAADHNTSRGGSAASCASPQLRLAGEQQRSEAAAARAGQVLTITGLAFLDVCKDTNHGPDPRPLKLDISLHGHGRTVLLQTVQACGSLGTFRTTVRIPADYPLGATTITTHTAGPPAEVAQGFTEGSPMQPIRLTIVK